MTARTRGPKADRIAVVSSAGGLAFDEGVTVECGWNSPCRPESHENNRPRRRRPDPARIGRAAGLALPRAKRRDWSGFIRSIRRRSEMRRLPLGRARSLGAI